MNIYDAKKLTISLMKQHNLVNWKFKFNNRKRSFGRCNIGLKIISLSTRFVELNNEDEVKETILHEIAHALAPINASHGYEWKKIAISIGCTGSQYLDNTKVKMPNENHIYQCQDCKREIKTYRKLKNINRVFCRRCRENGLQGKIIKRK